jgi:hypothetical protein
MPAINNPEGEQIASLVYWDTGQKILKVEISEIHDSLGLLNRCLKISDTSSGKTLLSYKTIDFPIAAFPLKDSQGPLITVWTSGSSYQVRVFGWRNGHPILLMEKGSKLFPEIFYSSKDPSSIYIVLCRSLIQDSRNKLESPDSCNAYLIGISAVVDCGKYDISDRINKRLKH